MAEKTEQKGLYAKLLEIQRSVDRFIKDMAVGSGSQAYKAVNSEQVLNTIRPLMNEYGLLLIPEMFNGRIDKDKTSSGTTRYFTEVDMLFTWLDVESGEKLNIRWVGHGTDLANEKGVGKAATYAEKYVLMKFFHIPTSKDDPDGVERTKTGEQKQKGTGAAVETALKQRQSVEQMLSELCGGDVAKIKQSVKAFTENKAKEYPGVENIADIKDTAIAVVYAQVKKKYESKTGKLFVFKSIEEKSEVTE